MPIDISTCLNFAYSVTKKVLSHIEGLNRNNAQRQSIEQNIETLQRVINKFTESNSDVPESYQDNIDSVNDSLGICKHICDSHDGHGKIEKLAQVGKHSKELATLESELKKASERLQFLYSQAIFSQTTRSNREIQRSRRDIIRDVIHPRRGIYLPNQEQVPRPQKLEQPMVALDEDLMEVTWEDRNDSNSYEVQYDDEEDQVVEAIAEECRLHWGYNTYSMKLGPPKIKLGHLYTVRVRGINGAGPGKWSEPVIFRFKSGPPNKPQPPTASALSPTAITITASRLAEEDENGSAVTHCIVEYTPKCDGNEPTWKNRISSMAEASEARLKVHFLQPDTVYLFRVKMRNAAGVSPPSDSIRVVTTQFKPGRPQNVCASSKRTSTTLTIMWEKPAENPRTPYRYRVQLRQENSMEWETPIGVDHALSYEFTRLNTFTKYLFRVRAINSKGKAGEWSHEVVEETRISKLDCALRVTAVGIGGTIAAPLIMSVIVAIEAAKENKEVTLKKKAALIAAGYGAGAAMGFFGAPFVGWILARTMFNEVVGN